MTSIRIWFCLLRSNNPNQVSLKFDFTLAIRVGIVNESFYIKAIFRNYHKFPFAELCKVSICFDLKRLWE
jgi:hypothetical protein